MFVKYSPEDGDVQAWGFDKDRVRQSEGELIERQYGENWHQFVKDMQAGNLRARRVLLWHLMRRDHPTLRYEDTPDFFTGELTVEFGSAELRRIRSNFAKTDVAVPEMEQVLAGLDVEIADAAAREEAEGKAPAASTPTTDSPPAD